MDDEPRAPQRPHVIGADLSRLSVLELETLKAACLAEAERIAREIAAKGSSRQAAENFFRR